MHASDLLVLILLVLCLRADIIPQQPLVAGIEFVKALTVDQLRQLRLTTERPAHHGLVAAADCQLQNFQAVE